MRTSGPSRPPTPFKRGGGWSEDLRYLRLSPQFPCDPGTGGWSHLGTSTPPPPLCPVKGGGWSEDLRHLRLSPQFPCDPGTGGWSHLGTFTPPPLWPSKGGGGVKTSGTCGSPRRLP